MMTRNDFEISLKKYAQTIEEIRRSAWELHRSVEQTYGGSLPYGHHLDMVVEEIQRFGHEVAATEDDVLPLIFGGYYHDSIEDARVTYRDVMKVAKRWLTDEQALTATEIVYALTNDKGRTRAERAGEHYYEGIRQTPYAPFVKICDRLANVRYSFQSDDAGNQRMKGVYANELEHFLKGITSQSDDSRLQIPPVAVEALKAYFFKN